MAWLRFETPFGPMALEGEAALTRLWLPGTLPDLAGDLTGQPEEDAISRLFD